MENNTENDKTLLWDIAGFKKDILADCKVDGHHVNMIAILLIIVGMYAVTAWTLFFLSVEDDILFALPLGIFMGLFIFFLDRTLIASLSKVKSSLSIKYATSVIFRIILALVIGYVLAEPIIHKIYEREISREVQILIDLKNKERKAELEKIFQNDIDNLESEKKKYNDLITISKNDYTNSSKEFSNEMDGTGGSKHRGYSDISMKKEEIAKKAEAVYNNILTVNQIKIDTIENQITRIRNKINVDYQKFKDETKESGPLIKAEALNSLVVKDKSNTLRNKRFLFMTILILIELSAFIAKFTYNTDSYSNKISNINFEEINLHKINREIAITKQEVYKEEATKNETEMLKVFFENSQPINIERLDEMLSDWNKKKYSLNELWLNFKDKFRHYKY